MYFGCLFFIVQGYKHDVAPQLARARGGKGCENSSDGVVGRFSQLFIMPFDV